MHSKSYNLRKERSGESCANQLTIGPAERRFVKTLADDTSGELVMFQFQMRRPFGIWMHQGLLRFAEGREQTVSRIEQRGAYQFEPLTSHATPIDA